MSNATLESLAKTAARWWAEAIRHANPSNDRNPALGAGITHIFAAYAKATVSNEAIDRFEETLRIAILDKLKVRAAQYPEFYIALFVEYVPCELLYNTAEESGLPNPQQHAVFPFKTRMWIHQDHIITNAGSEPLQLIP